MLEKENYVQFDDLVKEEKIFHLFTKKPFNFHTSFVTEEKKQKQYQEIESILKTGFQKIIKPIQCHTSNVCKVDENNLNESFEQVDGLVTNIKGIALVTSLADCQGVLLYDREKEVIGNIHSGWKGTLGRIVPKALSLMEREYGCQMKNIMVYICPSIQACCFEVDEDVKILFEEEFKDIKIEACIRLGEIKSGKQKYFIDTILVQKMLLEKRGILKENITDSSICTKCCFNTFHSYRGEKEKSGRNIALIALKK